MRRAVAHGHLELQLRGTARGDRRRGLRVRAGMSELTGLEWKVLSEQKTRILAWTVALKTLQVQRAGFGRVVTLFGRSSTPYQICEAVRHASISEASVRPSPLMCYG